MPDADIWGCNVQQQVHGGKEVIVGMNRDPQFGPLVMLGLGGIYVEVLKDVAFRIAPFSRKEAGEMMRELRSFNLLLGVRGEARSGLEGPGGHTPEGVADGNGFRTRSSRWISTP